MISLFIYIFFCNERPAVHGLQINNIFKCPGISTCHEAIQLVDQSVIHSHAL